MAIRDTYTKVHEDWVDLPDKSTPVYAEDLEHFEKGIKDAMDNRALKTIYEDVNINLMELGSTKKPGNYSIQYGGYSRASGEYSLAGGYNANAIGKWSFATGKDAKANGNCSQSLGIGTKSEDFQTVIGKYNETSYGKVFIIGGGKSDLERKTIFTVDQTGNVIASGDVTNGAGVSLNSLKSAIDNMEVIVEGGSIAKVFETKSALDEWLAVKGNPEALKIGQNIYILETGTPDYWWDGTGLQVLETDKVVIETLTYDETMAILNDSGEVA